MPTNLFSTISTLPTPCLPAFPFKSSSKSAGLSCLPFTETGVPSLNSIITSSSSFGALLGETVLVNISSVAETHGSSRAFPSYEMCNKLASVEYGGSPRLSFGTDIFLFSAHSINLVLESKSHSLQGAIILISGFSPR